MKETFRRYGLTTAAVVLAGVAAACGAQDAQVGESGSDGSDAPRWGRIWVWSNHSWKSSTRDS